MQTIKVLILLAAALELSLAVFVTFRVDATSVSSEVLQLTTSIQNEIVVTPMTNRSSHTWSVSVEVEALATIVYTYSGESSFGLISDGCAADESRWRILLVAQQDMILDRVDLDSCDDQPFHWPAVDAPPLTLASNVACVWSVNLNSY